MVEMPLDPDIKNLLKMMESIPRPDLTTTDIKEFRNFAEQSALIKTSEEVGEVKDMKFEHDAVTVRTRLYTPENAGSGLILYFHGGGFVFGSLDMYDGLCRIAANRSKTRVMSVDYRLAPENKFPAALEDALESLRWVQRSAKELDIDVEKIAVAGDSAGGNLAAGVCLKARDLKLKPPRLQVLIYPSLGRSGASMSMTEYSENYYLTEKDMAFFGKAYLKQPSDILDPYFSIINHPNLSGLPEALVVTAEYDPLRDEGETYLAKLQKDGTQATGIRAKGMIHGFQNFFPVVPASKNLLTMIWSFVGNILT
ncbi:MAG: alpha/beta hydrolase [Candidatus Thermoplasmatota archaeon]|nr:alpha/beta hydrolase [Candidatus Thermoplasmatota archaeon]MCL5790087.1 alpha/beta hydrolase [Candidatus Thermoplasmatota archaeon]